MGRLRFLLLELLSTNTCDNTYASARKTHDSKCTKTNLSKTFRAKNGTPANISEPFFQHALVFWIKATILWTNILCPFQRCLSVLTSTSLTFTRVPAKVPHIHKSSGEGAFCIWVTFRMCPKKRFRRFRFSARFLEKKVPTVAEPVPGCSSLPAPP